MIQDFWLFVQPAITPTFRNSYNYQIFSVVNCGLATHLDRLGQRRILSNFGLLLLDVLSQLLASLFHVEARLVEPGVLPDLVDGWSLRSIVREQSKDEVLELDGEISGVCLVEVEVVLVGGKQVVEVLVGASFLKGEYSLDDDEKDDSEREQVDFGAGVLFSFFDLGGHVGEGAPVALEVVDVLVASETEISNLQVQVIVDKDVLKLEISMGNFL